MQFGSKSFVDGLNAMALITAAVLSKRGLTDDQASNIVNEALRIAKDQMRGEDRVIITDSKENS